MSDFLNILTHERRLRANTKSLSVFELEEVKDKLTRVIAAREAEEAEFRQAEAEKQERVDAIHRQIKEAGLNLEDLAPELAAGVAKTKQKTIRKRAPKEAKYQYQMNGENKTWTGQGRTPKVIQHALDKGKSLKDFLIK